VPLGPIEPDAAFLLKISLQSPEQKNTRISVNGKLLAEEYFPPSQMVEKTYLCRPGVLKGSEENILEFQDVEFFRSLTLFPAGSGE